MMERYRPRGRTPAVKPFRDLEDMERMMEESWMRPLMWRRLPEEEFNWAPTMEILEKGKNYIMRMELPGISQEDVEISVSGDTITVKGERKPLEETKGEEYQMCEFCYGSFTRSITLPQTVNADKIEADFENGILEIRIPKAGETKPIQIKAQSKTKSQPQLSQGKSSKQSAERKSQSKKKVQKSSSAGENTG
jgi:HSP20 family protein